VRIFQEEIFGPVVTISSFESEDEIVRCANDMTFGLSVFVFTKYLERAYRVAVEVEAGIVWINSSQTSDLGIPFRGAKPCSIG
jgi:aldehyde dehydrogenase (NAD+)